MTVKMLIKNEWKGISKFCSMEMCTQMLALIWDEFSLCTSTHDQVIKILLEATNGL